MAVLPMMAKGAPALRQDKRKKKERGLNLHLYGINPVVVECGQKQHITSFINHLNNTDL